MIQFRQREGFFAEALASGPVSQCARRQNLQGYVAVELLIVCAINFAHPTFADFFDDAAVAQPLANHGRQTYSREGILDAVQTSSQTYSGDARSLVSEPFHFGISRETRSSELGRPVIYI